MLDKAGASGNFASSTRGLTAEMLENQDFYGTKIINEDDPFIQQLKDAALHVGETFAPISVSGFQFAPY